MADAAAEGYAGEITPQQAHEWMEAGDAVPADGRILESASLQIEEAALTGESVPVNGALGWLGNTIARW